MAQRCRLGGCGKSAASEVQRPSNHVVITQAVHRKQTDSQCPDVGPSNVVPPTRQNLCALGSTVIWCEWRGWLSVNIISQREAVGKIAFPSMWRRSCLKKSSFPEPLRDIEQRLSVPKTSSDCDAAWNRLAGGMIGLFRFALCVLALPFRSKLRLEAENAALRQSVDCLEAPVSRRRVSVMLWER